MRIPRPAVAWFVTLVLAGSCSGQQPTSTPSPSHTTIPGTPVPTQSPIATPARPTVTPAAPPPASATPTAPSATAPSPTAPPTVPPTVSLPSIPAITPPPTPAPNQTLGAPDWVAPGTRVTFYQAAASVAQSRFAWVEDPDGDWTDPNTGKKYRRTDESGEGVPTASGDGISQVDVIAVQDKDVVGNLNLYGIDHINNRFVLGGGTGGRVSGSLVDGSWIHPQLLEQISQGNLGGLLVLRGPYPLNGTTYQAISFANPTPGAYQSYTYDTATGLLLAATTSTAGATSPITAANEPPPVGNTQLTITRLAGVRQRTPPGVNGTNPPWVANTQRLDYSGSYNFINPVDPSSANLTFPMTLAVTLAPGGSNWAGYRADGYIQQPGGLATHAIGVGGPTGLYWMDTTALASMSAGDVLDVDPVSGERDTVVSIDQGPNGRAVTIDAVLTGIQSRATYDVATGVLLQLILATASDGTTITLQLQRMP